jgi:DNA-binding CsgD family transcriptional regulator/tetratricopeptide (TPR) repeat protein
MGGRMASPTFVGRVEELELLEAAMRRAADGAPAVVLLGGEAGVGKTRLVSELAARSATDGIRVLAGGCVPVGDGALPYAPIVEALRGLVAEVGAAAVRELVGPSWPELARLLPALGEPGRSSPPGQAAQARLFEVLFGLLGRLAEQAPVVLVVEDVHWADQSTRDLLAFLVRNLRRERVLLVVTYRNDEPGQQRLGPWLAELDRGGPVRRLELPRLDRAQTVAQLTGILGAAPAEDLVDGLFARSEGNPFFTEELLAVMQSGSGQLPTTLRDLLRGRVDVMPELARKVLAVVAVAGRPVPHRLLAAVADLDDRQLVEALRTAVASQLLVTMPAEDAYDVRHGLLREVIDADLLPGERAQLHTALARTIAELVASGELDRSGSAAEVAAHWYLARNPPKALEWSVRAAIEADGMHAYAEALGHYERALELWGRVADSEGRAGLDRAELLQRTAQDARISGEGHHSLALIDLALREMDPVAEPVRTGLLHERRGKYAGVVGDLNARFESLREAVRLIPADPPSKERAQVLASFADAMLQAAREKEAEAASREAIAIARQVGAERELGHALVVLGWAQATRQGFEAGSASFREACRLAEKHADPDMLALAYGYLAEELMQADRLEEAVEVSHSGREAVLRLGLSGSWYDTYLLGSAAEALFKLGRWDEADRLAQQALAQARSDERLAFLMIAALEIGRGEFDAAEAHLSTIEDRVAGGSREFTRMYLVLVAELRIWQSRFDEAWEAVAAGLDRVAGTDEARSGRLICLGMRALADLADHGRAHHDSAKVEKAVHAANALVSQVATMLPNPLVPDAAPVPSTTAVVALWKGERSRLVGRSDPAQWAVAAAAWSALRRPYPTAYAQWRQAEALLANRAPRAQAEEALRAAHVVAVRLGATSLRRELELLAQRGRIQLEPPADPAIAVPQAPSAAASLGLTRREIEVLALVAEGRTNRQIGQELFITPKTAGVHVSRILAKLGVAGRGEAAAIAHRLGLDKH